MQLPCAGHFDEMVERFRSRFIGVADNVSILRSQTEAAKLIDERIKAVSSRFGTTYAFVERR